MRCAVLVLALLAGACVQDIKQNRVETALVNAGLPQPLSECMARRMAEKLTIAQLRRLQALGVEKRTYGDYIRAVKNVHDNDALEVLLASFALCKTGIVR
ncbi:MAG: hypothetical protein KGN34_11665 [Sphingomonadales bacterium]|nr:hypothetical protein [Sphingomonadales bacterium]